MAISSILLISKYGNFAVKINHPGDLGSGRGSDFERERGSEFERERVGEWERE